MKFPILMMGTVAVFALAQDPPVPVPAPESTPPTAPAATPAPAATKFYAEQFQRLRGEIAELKTAHALQQKESEKLKAQIKLLAESNLELSRKLTEKFATEEDLKSLQSALKELDANRIEDRGTLMEAIKNLGVLIDKVAKQKVATEPVNATPRTVAQDFKYNEHEVEAGQFLSTIIIAYNSAYKKEGLGTVTQSQVLKANPGLNPNRLLVGQKIKIPLPGEIK